MTDPYSPRENDHLVEPMYAGLEVEHSPSSGKARTRWLLGAVLLVGVVVLIAVLW